MASALTLDRVLSCPTLPTLPAVAMQVLELTRDPNITVAKLAKLVQADPSLSAKVLRTVNSSFFGLPSPCSKIDRALSLLGLNTIKSLVLGFTLVEGTRGVPGDTGLDLTRHWRRAVYAAAAARHVAMATGACDPDEAFTAAMLQDIGMMACIVSFPEAYAPIISPCLNQHEPLPAVEREALGFDHATVGAALARKWKLPEHLAQSIEHHHAPDGADESVRPLTKTVWMGMIIAESMGIEGPANSEARFLIMAADFFRCPPSDLGPMLHKIAEGADGLASAFDREVGAMPNIKEIMAAASEQMLEAQMNSHQQTSTLERENQALTIKATTDALTGAYNRTALESEGPAAFEKSRAAGTPFSTLFIDADKFKSVNDTHGHPAGDAVLIELAARVKDELSEPVRAYRYGGEEFAILAPGLDAAAAGALAERIRARIEREPFDLSKVPGAPSALRVTISAGHATTTHLAGEPAGLPALLKLADEGVYKSKQDGRNRVSCVQNRTDSLGKIPLAIADGGILLIEDDPFSAKLVMTAVQKATGCLVTWVKRAEEGVKQLSSTTRFRLVLCDFDLGTKTALDVLANVTKSDSSPAIHVLTSNPDDDGRARCLAAGAAAYTSKDDIANDLAKWCKQLTEALRKAA